MWLCPDCDHTYKLTGKHLHPRHLRCSIPQTPTTQSDSWPPCAWKTLALPTYWQLNRVVDKNDAHTKQGPCMYNTTNIPTRLKADMGHLLLTVHLTRHLTVPLVGRVSPAHTPVRNYWQTKTGTGKCTTENCQALWRPHAPHALSQYPWHLLKPQRHQPK